MESLQNSKGLIFEIYLNTEKSLFCYFFYSNSTQDMGLDQAFRGLSNSIRFGQNGSVDLKLFEF